MEDLQEARRAANISRQVGAMSVAESLGGSEVSEDEEGNGIKRERSLFFIRRGGLEARVWVRFARGSILKCNLNDKFPDTGFNHRGWLIAI